MTVRRARVARVLAFTLVGLLTLATVALVAAWAFQSRIVYHPSRATPPPAAEVVGGASDVRLTTEDGLTLGAWYAGPAAGTARGQAVLVLPGNAGNRAVRAPLVRELAARGFAVLIPDYRGFGGNPGTPSEAGLLLDARAAQQALAARGYPASRTIYFGESIGTGVAAALQERVPPAGLVLRSPFTSLPANARHLAPLPLPVLRLVLDRNRFPTAGRLAASDVPVTVIQGDADGIVPPSQSDAVAAAAGDLFEHVVIPGAGHNDAVMLGPPVADAVVRLADHVRSAGRAAG